MFQRQIRPPPKVKVPIPTYMSPTKANYDDSIRDVPTAIPGNRFEIISSQKQKIGDNIDFEAAVREEMMKMEKNLRLAAASENYVGRESQVGGLRSIKDYSPLRPGNSIEISNNRTPVKNFIRGSELENYEDFDRYGNDFHESSNNSSIHAPTNGVQLQYENSEFSSPGIVNKSPSYGGDAEKRNMKPNFAPSPYSKSPFAKNDEVYEKENDKAVKRRQQEEYRRVLAQQMEEAKRTKLALKDEESHLDREKPKSLNHQHTASDGKYCI